MKQLDGIAEPEAVRPFVNAIASGVKPASAFAFSVLCGVFGDNLKRQMKKVHCVNR